ncbi:MAG: efflux RND transporter permease subunit [Candidatus Omnitrophota bacterium]
MGLPSMSIKKPVFITMIFLAVMILGTIAMMELPVELYQGRAKGIISIVVNARGGLPPLEVEKNITKPVEESVSTVSHLKNMYSSSREAESRVTLEFEVGTDMNFAALEVREKFARVKPLLPKEIEKPVIANYDDNESAFFIFAMTSEILSPEQVRDLVETELKPILGRVNGVASVEVYGGRQRKILIEIDRDKLTAYNISIERVMDILGQSNVNLLAGNVDSGTLEYAIRSMGAFLKIEEIGDIGIQATRQGSIIPLKEIATIKDSYMEANDYSRLNLEQNVTVYVKKSSLSQAIPVAKTLKVVLDEYKQLHKDELDVIVITDQAETIQKAIDDVKFALFLGMGLTVVLIYLFLKSWILAFIVFLSIPCSVIATFIFMGALGISINIMTLSGLALAIGILIDSAVVILENVFSKKEKNLSDEDAIREGAEEVWMPLLASLLTTLIVFLPIVFIDKSIQIRYSGFAFTVCASLIASFFVAQMAVPVMLEKWAKGHLTLQEETEASRRRSERFRFVYGSLIRWSLRLRYPVTILCFFSFYVAGMKIAKMSIDYPSALEENEFSVVVFPLAGAKLESNDDSVKKVEEMLAKISDVEMFSSTVRKDTVRVFVRLKPKGKRQYSKDEIMRLLDEKGNEAVKEVHDDYSLIIDEGVSSSEDKKIVINIFGHDNEQLEKLAREFAGRMGKVPGISNIVMTDLRKRPEYSLVVDKGRAAIYGLTVKKIADSVHAQVRGMRPTKFHELKRGEEIETITRLQAIYRQKIEDLKLVPLATNGGTHIPLGEIANFYPSTGPQTIDRKDKYRYVFVKGDVKGALEGAGVAVKEALKDVTLPEDYYWRYGGSYTELMAGKSQLTVALLLTLFLVYMCMACLFQNYIQPFLIMISVPMCSIGVWAGLVLTKKPLSESVFIGMILLSGYVVNAAIIMMDHMNHLLEHGVAQEQALIQSGLDRLRPITITTLAAILGFLPLAINLGQSSDLWSPLAVTVIGGLISSHILTLFVLPNFIMITQDIGNSVQACFRFLRAPFGAKIRTVPHSTL